MINENHSYLHKVVRYFKYDTFHLNCAGLALLLKRYCESEIFKYELRSKMNTPMNDSRLSRRRGV